MLFSDTFLTIDHPGEGQFKDKGSKFIGLAYPISNENDVKKILTDVKKQYHDARHHCFAYVLGPDKAAYRINDDGEPSGSAGRPIYNTILSKDLTNILIVVVRYFGGTKLGIPGLIHAYKEATLAALSSTITVEKVVMETYQLDFSFQQLNDVMRMVKDFSLKVIDSQFDNSCSIVYQCRLNQADFIKDKFLNDLNISAQAK